MYDSIVSAYEFLAKGGVVMIFIIASSIVAIVLFIERLIVFRHERTRSQRLIEPLIEAIKLGQFERAFTLCDEHRGCMARIARTALTKRDIARDDLISAVGDEGHVAEVYLNRRVPSIGAISTLSPLLGLLGTVTGMITIFSQMADEYAAGMTANQGMLAGGIWEALLTTAAGLCVAIPAFIMHRALCAKIDDFMIELESSATRIVDLLAPPPQNALAQAPTPTPQAAIDVANASTQAADPPRDANLPNDEASK